MSTVSNMILNALANCLIYAWPLLAHRSAYRNKHFAADDNEMGSYQAAVGLLFRGVLLLNQIYLTKCAGRL